MNHRNIRRGFYLVMGWCALAIGLVGLALPIMPGTIFLIIALACFAKSNQRLEKWLLEHPRLGPPLKEWQNSRRISPTVKTLAITAITLTTLGVILFVREHIEMKILLSVGTLVVCIYLLRLSPHSLQK